MVEWQFYNEIFSEMLKNAPDYLTLDLGQMTILDLLNAQEMSMDSITIDFSKVSVVHNLREIRLRFECGTYKKGLKYNYYLKVVDLTYQRQMPLMRSNYLRNKAVNIFADMILSFIQSLVGYAARQESHKSMAMDFGVPVRFLPSTFSWNLKDWEKEFKVPSLGTNDILGSFMKHIYDGSLNFSDRGLKP